jgi:LysR family hydrogen peroxide-inducible transcriptional activator
MKDPNFSLRQLRYFLVTARHRSLRQAALELGIAQPSLSAQLRALEDALEVQLLERSRGGVALTPAGRSMLAEARVAVGAAETIREAAQLASHGPSGAFRLGVAPSLGPYILPWVLPGIRDEYRGVKFFVREAVTTALVEGLKAGSYDLILTPMPAEDPALVMVPILCEPIHLVVYRGHPLAELETIEPAQLAGMEILTLEEHHLFFQQVEQLCKRFNARLLRDFEGTSLDAIRQMVYMEMGAAFLPALYIRSEIRDRDELRVVRVEGEFIHRVHGFVWRRTSPFRVFYRDLTAFVRRSSERQFGDYLTAHWPDTSPGS